MPGAFSRLVNARCRLSAVLGLQALSQGWLIAGGYLKYSNSPWLQPSSLRKNKQLFPTTDVVLWPLETYRGGRWQSSTRFCGQWSPDSLDLNFPLSSLTLPERSASSKAFLINVRLKLLLTWPWASLYEKGMQLGNRIHEARDDQRACRWR